MIAEETPILAPHRITRSDDHTYYYEGNAYPGVTSILKVIDKSGPLMAWAAKQTAEAALTLHAERPADKSALDLLIEGVGRDGAIRALTSRANWQRDEAAALGSEVHRLADLHVRDPEAIPVVGETVADYVRNYREWWSTAGWTLRASEAFVLHPEFGYGGTIDLLGRDADGRTVLADIKTGKGVYAEAVLQLTAYGDATLIQLNGTVYQMPAIDRYVILHVTKEGVREVEINVGTLERLAWAGCMDLAAWHRTMKGKRL